SDGFGLLGQTTHSRIRSYSGSAVSMMCSGYDSTSTAGYGVFDYVPGDATTEDDDCVHIRDGLGRLWKRRFEGNKIRMAWAGGKNLYQSSEPQDVAFKKCLKAAASLSESGYPQSIIVGLDFGVTHLAERHYIRCGSFPESMAWKLPPEGGGCRFGIHGIYAIDEGAGFFVVQANNPDFNFQVDNTGIDFNVDNYTDVEIAVLVQSNYILRLESMVNAPDIRIHAGNYPGTVIYSSGKKDYSAVTAQWPDLT
ncbi:TPA: hypothetical protein R2K42_005722, partial [Raoultella ornithinolytica]|nr:hypothetical protein [Raoultella ornithinolytica]